MKVNLAKDVFIWTEAFNCGEILDPMLKSYLAHNEFELNIFGTSKDFNHVTVKSSLLKFHDLNMDEKTSKLWNELKSIGKINPKVLPEDVVFISLRDFEKEEKIIKRVSKEVIVEKDP